MAGVSFQDMLDAKGSIISRSQCSSNNAETPRIATVESEGDGRCGTTQRGLKSRHIQLIALGGCIGTGLFVGTGSTLSLVGPAPLLKMASKVEGSDSATALIVRRPALNSCRALYPFTP